MYKHRRFRTTISGSRLLGSQYLKDFLPRQPIQRLEKLHPNAKKVYNRMIQKPLPLEYKLHQQIEGSWEVPLGNVQALPFQVRLRY